MLGEFKFTLFAENDGWIPGYPGYLIRAAILKKISSVNPDLADFCHESNMVRHYALGRPFIKASSRPFYSKDRKLRVDQGMMISFPLRTLNKAVTREMIKSVTLFKDLHVRLNPVNFITGSVEFKTVNRPVIGDSSPAPVQYSGFFNFRTPVAFATKKSKHTTVWPDPAIIIHNLLNIYSESDGKKENENTSEFDRIDFLESVGSHVFTRLVKRWLTRSYPLGNYRTTVGGMGELAWGFDLDFPKEYKRIVRKLLFFGTYSNTGTNRTAGMGNFT
ncbi:MAG: CRISPR system precrRNA processing endoribonuclease RAMP protein Cas6, partial [Candidatus Hodarchaeales archaeon]